MIRLLRADFTRIFKSAVFWLCVIFAFLLELGTVIFYDAYMTRGASEDWGIIIIRAFRTSPIFIAIFISMFLGEEYSAGAIRNKLVIGGERSNIYAANFIASVVCGILITIAQVAPAIIRGFIHFSKYSDFPPNDFWKTVLLCFLTLTAFSSLLSFFGMVCSKKAITAAASILFTFICFFSSTAIIEIIESDSYTYEYVKATLTGVDRVLPFGTINRAVDGYMMDYYNKDFFNSVPLFALGTIAVSSGTGMLVFRKKDLK